MFLQIFLQLISACTIFYCADACFFTHITLSLRAISTKPEYKMAYKINPDLCSACGTCIDECPVEAISAGDVYVIDAGSCIDCGACSGACPVDAISAE